MTQQLLRPLNPRHSPLQPLKPLLSLPIPLLNPLHLHRELRIALLQEPDPLPQTRALAPLVGHHLVRLREQAARQLLDLRAHGVHFGLGGQTLRLRLRELRFELSLSRDGRGRQRGCFARVHEAAEARQAARGRRRFCTFRRRRAVEGVVALLREAQLGGQDADVVFVVCEALGWDGC